VDKGADAIEFDLQVTSDGEVVVIHDPTLERTTNGAGLVQSSTLTQLRKLDAGARFTRDGKSFPYRGRGLRLPTFNEVVDAMPAQLPLLIELKTARASEPLRRIIRDRKLGGRVLVAGFDRRAVHPLRGEGFPTGASTSEAVDLLLPALRRSRIRVPQFDALCIPPRWNGVPIPVRAFARILATVNRVVHVWTINDPAEAQKFWRNGVSGIVTDDPALMLAARSGA